MSTNLYTEDGFSEVSLQLDLLEQTSQRLPESEQQTPVAATEIWVGYIKHGRSFIDKLPKADNIELQLYAFDEYYKRSFSPAKRFISKWILCKKPVIYAGELSAIDPRALEHQHFPHEVHFKSVKEQPDLSIGFARLETPQDHPSLFHDDQSFDVGAVAVTLEKRVLCIGHKVHKKRLSWLLVFSVMITAASTIVAGVVLHDFGSGVQLGALVGATFGTVWVFIMWLLG